MTDQLVTGETHIDEDGRLLPREPPRPPNANLEPPPRFARAEQDRRQDPLNEMDEFQQPADLQDQNLANGRSAVKGLFNAEYAIMS